MSKGNQPVRPLVAQRYEIVGELGSGGMAQVFLAEDTQRGRQRVALKCLHQHFARSEQFVQRFVREARNLERLKHPHIVQIHDCLREGGQLYLVLQCIHPSHSLEQLLSKYGRVPHDAAVELIKPVVAALDHAHQSGVIHRDVKPSNILVDRERNAYLCDFGIAKQVAERGLTVVGMVVGTPAYMSPEQSSGLGDIDHRTDVYSIGLVLYETLTGKLPADVIALRQEASRSALSASERDALQQQELIDSGVPKRLVQIVMKATRHDRSRRYQGCAALHADLNNFPESSRGSDNESTDTSSAGSRSTSSRGNRIGHFTVYSHPTFGKVTVSNGWCWPAATNLVWMYQKGLYRKACIWALCYSALAAVVAAQGEGIRVESLVVVAAAITALWIWPVVIGNRWRKEELSNAGFNVVGEIEGRG